MDISQSILSGEQNVNDVERWCSVVVGAAMAVYGLSRRSAGGFFLAAAGGALVFRGATGNCPIYQALGLTTVEEEAETAPSHVSVEYGAGIAVEKSVTINATPEKLYAFWRNFENLPRFMSHLRSVRIIDSKRSHWSTRGPAGSEVSWDAEIINEVPDELIGWRSLQGSDVNHAGSVHFTEAGDRGTQVRVILRYDPPGGATGATFAKLLGEDPAQQIEEDLRSLKELIEKPGERGNAKF